MKGIKLVMNVRIESTSDVKDIDLDLYNEDKAIGFENSKKEAENSLKEVMGKGDTFEITKYEITEVED